MMFGLLLIPQRYEFSSKSQLNPLTNKRAPRLLLIPQRYEFSSKSQQGEKIKFHSSRLLLIPQRYEFSSKSQHLELTKKDTLSCCWYHKGTNFQANHNLCADLLQVQVVVADTTKVRIFKQITTSLKSANASGMVVADTTKVRIFKQITTQNIP